MMTDQTSYFQLSSEEGERLLWEEIVRMQGKTFYTAKNLEYTYTIKGYEMFVTRKDKSITRATINLAFGRAMELQKSGREVTGPKKLGVFGASYLYPVFIELGVICKEKEEQ